MTKIYLVKSSLNHLTFVMDVNLEVVVEKNDLLIMQEKQMILKEKKKVKLGKVLV